MRELLLSVEREARSSNALKGPGAIVVLTAKWPQASNLVSTVMAGAQLIFEPPPGDGEPRFCVAGLGEAARIDAAGAQRVSTVQAASAALFASLIERRAPDCAEAPAPRLYGGFRFAPAQHASANEDPWRDFPDASFALPRWVILHRDGSSYLQLAVRASELIEHGAAPLCEELDAIERVSNDITAASPNLEHDPPQLEEPPPELWRAFIENALSRIQAGELAKVVAARRCTLRARGRFNVAAALSHLRVEYPSCTRFAIQRGGAVFLGATPEKLVERSGMWITADALAGSHVRKLNSTPADEPSERDALLHDDKERREHAHVVSAIRAVFERYAESVNAATQPSLRTLRNLHHLHTPISATLRVGEAPVHVLELIDKLHPTPAVCGVPREAAARFIAAHEPAARGFYAAPIGWFNSEGEGQFCVALRCAVVTPQTAWLFAGAGIVAGSNPDREYRETAAKLRPMLAALGSRA